MCYDADDSEKETDRRSYSGVTVMHGGLAMSSTSRTQHCVNPSTTGAVYVAMAEEANECMFVERFCLFCGQELCWGVRQSTILLLMVTTTESRLWPKTLSVQAGFRLQQARRPKMNFFSRFDKT